MSSVTDAMGHVNVDLVVPHDLSTLGDLRALFMTAQIVGAL